MKNANENVIKKVTLSDKLDENVNEVLGQMGESYDLIHKIIELKSDDKKKSLKIGIFLINGLTDQNFVNETIIENIVKNYKFIISHVKQENLIDVFNDYIVTLSEVKISNNFIDLFTNLIAGDTILIIDGENKFFQIGSRKYPERAIVEPKTHISIMGPKESFTESLVTNTALLRRKLKNPNLWIKTITVGDLTNTNVALCYLKGVADEAIVKEAQSRLEKIEIDSILDISYIVAALKETKGSLFPTIQLYERPDSLVSQLIEGKVVIIADGSPYGMGIPSVFIQFLQTAEDYHKMALVSTFFRLLRMIGFVIAVFLPCIYIVLTVFHSELLPFPLLVRIAAQREGLPFPSWIEAISLCLVYDLLREASLRMPVALGNTISIVGALVLGDAAIQAGIISPIMLIIVSITAISTLSIPNYHLQVTAIILKYVFIICTIFLGLYGLILGLYALLIHMTSLRNFGVAYLAPFSPNTSASGYDGIIRKPLKNIVDREGNFTSKYPY